MGSVRALPRGHVRGPGPRTWLVSFVFALAALSGSATLLFLNVTTVVLEDPALLSPVKVLDSLPSLNPRDSTPAESALPAAAAVVSAPQVSLPAAPAQTNFLAAPDEDLEEALYDAVNSQGGGMSIALIRLEDGATAAIDGDETWYSASLFKLAVLYEVERQLDAGTIKRSDRLVLTDADLAEDLGTAWDLPIDGAGTVSVEEALDAMVTHSDNSTAVALIRLAGGYSQIDTTLKSLGLTGTSVNTEELPTTAADMALLMEALATGKGLKKESAEEVRTLLLDQETRSGIPSGAPEGAKVGNKTGTWPGATHDVAFIATESGTYILAILSDRSWGWDAVSNATWHIFNALEE